VTGGTGSTDGEHLILARFGPGGALDHTFSGDGKLQLHFGFGDVEGAAVAIQQDGKIVVAGQANETGSPGGSDMAVFRFLPNGALDRTFNLDGSKMIPFGSQTVGFAHAVAIQADGKIVVAGSAAAPQGDTGLAAARLLPNGKLDPTFGSGGRALRNVTAGNDLATGMAIQPNGRIVMTGVSDFLSSNQQAVTIRLTAAGRADHTFNGDGVELFAPPSGTTQGQDVAVQKNGKVVVAATADDGTIDLIRYTSGGALDSGFGTGGVATLQSGASDTDRAGALAIQGDGKIVVVGAIASAGVQKFLAARVLAE
jgi:uncharacterized delta-60 repeat protein